MAERNLKSIEAYGSDSEYLVALRAIASEYGNMPIDNVFSAYSRAAMTMSPFIQNRRVKAISTLPSDPGKDAVAEMVKDTGSNEEPLRAVMHSLEGSTYPIMKMRKTYQDINTDRYFFYPTYLADEKSAKSDEFWREGALLDKLVFTLKPEQIAHEARGAAIQEGKVAIYPRFSIDKAHNSVNYAFFQRLPSDWWKIIGGNNISKHTVMFDMMYFLQPGADWRQFGDLFKPFVNDFNNLFDEEGASAGVGTRFIFASAGTVKTADGRQLYVNTERFNEIWRDRTGKPEVYNQNGRWAYWVTLPIDKIWFAEIDDTSRNAVSPLTGLFLGMDQLAAYESVQLEILQNPLVSVVLGEIPYFDDKENTKGEADKYKLSGAGRRLFENRWYQMLQAANTSGIGFFTAPANNLHLESLKEAPNASDITIKGYQGEMLKSGMSGLIPINDNPRAGSVAMTASLEERFSICIYFMMENMMNYIFKSLNLKNEWRFKMFGGMTADEKTLKRAKDGMMAGLLEETFFYYALIGISLFAAKSMSLMIKASGIMDLRLPLPSSYTAKNTNPQLPPQPVNTGGRPPKGIGDNPSDSQEESLDAGG